MTTTAKVFWLVVVIAIAYYFLVTQPQQQAITQQQQAAAAQQADQQAAQEQQASQQEAIQTERSDCSVSAQKEAVTQYENSLLCTSSYAPSTCTDNSTFNMQQYTNDYDVCLESLGLPTTP